VAITDEAAQQARTGQTAAETVAGLNRDTQNAHQGPLDHNPDLDEILAKQAEIADAAYKLAQPDQMIIKKLNEERDRLKK